MTNKSDKTDLADFFTADVSAAYDKRNSGLAPIADNMHFLIRLVLKNLPLRARILCVGVGTGAEILSLAQAYPQWSFVGVDPAAPMLAVCRERLMAAGIMTRCALIHGYVQDVPAGETFDAALSILVGHFVAHTARVNFYRSMQERLKPGGYFINTELSFDLDSVEFPTMLNSWARVQELMGATRESLQALPHMLRETLCVLPPKTVETLMRESGITLPVPFFQAFMIHGWYAQKTP